MNCTEHNVVLPAEITLREAPQIASVLKGALANIDAVAVDLRGVTTIDVSILQLLAAFNADAASRGRKVALLCEPGSSFERTAAAAGFSGMRSAAGAGEGLSGADKAAARGATA